MSSDDGEMLQLELPLLSACDAFFWLLTFTCPGDLENQAEMEEKTRLINQVLELQHTLEGKCGDDISGPSDFLLLLI